MHTALFFVDISASPTNDESEKLHYFLDKCRDISDLMKETQKRSDYCWQIPLHSELHVLGRLVAEAKAFGLPCRTLFFEKEPPFVITEPPIS